MEALHARKAAESTKEICTPKFLFIFLRMSRTAYELYPGHYFLERRKGTSLETLSHDNDYEVCITRFLYQVEMGESVRLVDWKGRILLSSERGVCAKKSAALKGKKHSSEHRAKITFGLLAHYVAQKSKI